MNQLNVGHQLSFELATVGPVRPSHAEMRETVDAAFEGFIGNQQATHALKRSLYNAMLQYPPRLNKNLLFVGSASCGKTELAKRMAAAMGLPFAQMNGLSLRNGETLIELVDAALKDFGRAPCYVAPRGGIRVKDYPAFIVFIDEAHNIPRSAQEGLLTLLEMDDRTMMVGAGDEREIIRAWNAGFILATTKPSKMDKPLRSRCVEVPLARYKAEEVAEMVRGRFPSLPTEICELCVAASRRTPRVAFEIAREIESESKYQGEGDVTREHALQVLRGRGVVSPNGITVEDVRYLSVLRRENRPIGERVAVNLLGYPDVDRLAEDIEPYLVDLGYVRYIAAGREITAQGRRFLERYEEAHE